MRPRRAFGKKMPGLWFWLFALVVFAVVQGSASDWQQGPGFKTKSVPVAQPAQTGFVRMDPTQTGLTFKNLLSKERSITNRVLLSGSGVAFGDVDGDGFCDLYFCALDNNNALYRNLGNWRFQEITDSAEVACANQASTGAVLADVDGDRDLDLLVTSLGNGVRLFTNDGRGRFAETTQKAGLTPKAGSMSMALADLDRDRDLDLYVVNYRPTTLMDQPTTQFQVRIENGRPHIALVDGRPATLPELTNRFIISPAGNILETGEEDFIFLNDGHGVFKRLPFTGGAFLDEDGHPLAEPPRDWGLAVQIRDLNGDGAPDIYVCNDLFSPDRLWINKGKGQFRAAPPLALRHTSTFTMGLDFADIDRDGDIDLFTTDMSSRDHQKRHVQVATLTPVQWLVGIIENRPQFSRNMLQLNRGDVTFAEIGFYSGVDASDWTWGPVFLDVDLDGFEDILLTNGSQHDVQNADMARQIEQMRANRQLSQADLVRLVGLYPRLESTTLIFRNRGDLTFEEVGASWGFHHIGISQGMALGDLDNDGDLDVVYNELNGNPGLYQNETGAPRLAVRLSGCSPNTSGIGARITVSGGPVLQSQEIIAGGRYLSGDQASRTFAAGTRDKPLKIEVRWPSGQTSVVQNANPDRIYEIEEDAAPPANQKAVETGYPQNGARSNDKNAQTEPPAKPFSAKIEPPPVPLSAQPPCFEDASALIRHHHVEEFYDDFARQPLMPRRLSQLGPGAAWCDLDGDGWDDLLIGTGRGGELGIYRNDAQGGFKRMQIARQRGGSNRDKGMLLLAAGKLFIAESSYEDGSMTEPGLRIFDVRSGKEDTLWINQPSTIGPIALADLDADGDLDLFAGGRVIPGRYPEAASSIIYRQENGRWKEDAPNSQTIGQTLVSAALWSDLDNDGFPELALACEWSGLRLFKNKGGLLQPWNPPVTTTNNHSVPPGATLQQFAGWWNGIAAADLNNDGLMDLVASNWGLNSKYGPSWHFKRRVYFGDLDNNGTLDLIESYFNPAMAKEVPERGLNLLQAALPFVVERVGTYANYGALSVQEIYGDRLSQLPALEINHLASTAFHNQGSSLALSILPQEAQFAPAFGVSIGDMDGDGDEDIFLSQNFFAPAPDSPRDDAGRGLWLLGDGAGRFTPSNATSTGVSLYGEQRGSALGDFNQDGRLDLVVTQNGAQTILFKNRSATPGLRVKLLGSPGNPQGIGAMVRVEYSGGHLSPAKEIHAGSGYWSQNSAVLIFAMNKNPEHVRVRWPGGKTTRTPVPANTRSLSIGMDGALVNPR